jgi:hypothetical protein
VGPGGASKVLTGAVGKIRFKPRAAPLQIGAPARRPRKDRGRGMTESGIDPGAGSADSPTPRRIATWGRCRTVPGRHVPVCAHARRSNGSVGPIALLCVVSALGGCATADAPDFSGSWRSANRFAEATEAIPLHDRYRYQALPTDRTLRTMIGRWAQDTGRTLDYRHPYDFTLHAPAARIASTRVEDAVAQVSATYAREMVSVTADGRSITVRRAAADAPAAPEPGAVLDAAAAPGPHGAPPHAGTQ